jgi:hypothetical protein
VFGNAQQNTNERLLAAEQICVMLLDEDFPTVWQQTSIQIKDDLRGMVLACLEMPDGIEDALAQIISYMFALDLASDEYVPLNNLTN